MLNPRIATSPTIIQIKIPIVRLRAPDSTVFSSTFFEGLGSAAVVIGVRVVIVELELVVVAVAGDAVDLLVVLVDSGINEESGSFSLA